MYKLTTGWPQLVGTGVSVNPDTNPDYLQWLSEGNTPEPADAPPPPTVTEQIAAIERANPVTQRNLREMAIALATLLAQVTGGNVQDNPGVRKALQIEAQVATLRAQLG